MKNLRLPQARSALESFLTSQVGAAARVVDLAPLTGGASRASWTLDVEIESGDEQGKHRLVLRQDMGGEIHDEALSREQEHRMLAIAHQEGVLVPRPRWLCIDDEVLGSAFFLMDHVSGESVGRRIVKDNALVEARRRLPQQMAEQIARIHGISFEQQGLSFLKRPEGTAAQHAVTALTTMLKDVNEPHPVLELAVRWLTRNAPASSELVLCHGDFRLGNFLIDPDGLRSVLDWEFAHVGDPVEDLAWPCVRSWRFGNDDLRLAGVGQPNELLDAYCQITGRARDELEARMTYWEIMGNLRWAVGCMRQARRHLSGQTKSLELVSLGRRTAEVELELLDLLENAVSS